MQQQLAKRLEELKAEFELGQKKLHELETESNNVRSTLLRISGAVQVLEEILAQQSEQQSEQNGQAAPSVKIVENHQTG